MSADADAPPRVLPVDQARAELKKHFNNYSGDAYATGWDDLWKKGDFLPWDRGAPSPALADTLINHSGVVGHALLDGDGEKRRKRALVPGCGRGVDVLLLSSFGYDVVGLEYADNAVKACEEHAKLHGDKYPVRDQAVGAGSVKFLQGDFYAADWLERSGWDSKNWDGKFDLIYDYTFFCAMQPSMRPAWAKRMTELLKSSPQANLVCLEFPVSKPPKAGGPPYGLSPNAYLEHLSHPGEEVPYAEDGHVKSNPLAPSSSGGLERVAHWHPADTHKVGKDAEGNVQDYISVWRHR